MDVVGEPPAQVRRGDGPALAEPPTITRWLDLVRLLAEQPGLHVPRGRLRPARGGGVHDEESGCVLPGLPVLRLAPEPWWTGSLADWAARQVVHHLGSRRGADPLTGRVDLDAAAEGPTGGLAVLRGREVGRGWDGEVLLGQVEVVALLSPQAAADARRHHARLRSGRWPAPTGDVDWIVLS